MTTVVTIKPALPNVVDTPSVGILPNLPVITGALGRLQASSFGTSALTFCQGNDTRVVNAVQTTGSYADPAWVTALAASKITGTFMKSQQHAQTAYLDQANTWAQAQIFDTETRFKTATWHKSTEGKQRFYFDGDGTTYIQGHAATPLVLRNGDGSDVLSLASTHEVSFGANNLKIHSDSTGPWIQSYSSRPLRLNPLGNEVRFTDNYWIQSTGGVNRINFITSGTTYLQGYGSTPFILRNGSHQNIVTIAHTGGALFSGSVDVNSYARINGAAGGASTYLQLLNNESAIGILGSDASISGGNAADVGLFVYGDNEFCLWANSTRMIRVNDGGSTFSGAATFNGQVSAATEFRLGGNSFSRVAQMDGAGGWGGGYNFNINSNTSQRDSTGTVAAIRFDQSSVQLFAESSGSPGAISPRYSFGPTQATFVSPLGINNGSGEGRIGLGPDSFIQADANEMVVSQRGAGSLYQDFGTSTIFRRTSDFATMATIASNGTANFLSTVTTPSVVSHGLTIVDGITGASNWRFYKNASDTNLYLRNEINARMHAVFSVGADSNDSNSHFCSRLTAEGGIYSARNESWIGFSDNNNYLGGITHFRPVAGGSTAVTINGATGAATFNSTVSADAFRHRNSAGEFPWMLYSPGTDVNWYIRDLVNSRMQMMFTPGASAGAAVTNVYSQLTVEGNATFSGTITAQSDRPVKSYFGFTTYQGDAGGYIIGSRFRGPSDTDLGFIGVHGTGDNLYTYFIGVYGNEIVSFNNTNKAATFNGSVKLGIKTIATLPSAASSSGERYQVSDSATIANRIAFSNGSAWYYEGTAVAV